MNKCQENRLLIFERITAEVVSNLILSIGKLVQGGVSEVELMINSKGGSVSAALNLCDVMVASGIKFTGIVVADCLSSTVTVLQVCQKRTAFPNASFLIHNTSRKFEVWLDKSQTLEYFQAKLAEEYKQASEMDDRNRRVLLSRVGKAHRKEFDKLYSSGEHFFPEDALEVGLIDKIITKI